MLSTTEQEKRNARKRRQKYTRNGSVGNSEDGGWSERGLQQFNELCQTVDEDRKDPKHKQ